ncbi:Site-specific DNA recombinase [Mucilaginibacter gossypiicola]|uniref:Site-specific DNA recombinase n=1 Tax=Mucilaginibacter gossypiicola TaxID=551995 RepID=A0A1H8ER39_9SPHI|nr:recombinase family protein [Mucilaginibacter gossypiicola]SEN22051.1 Site-specific DNA recombinase [Mucilaginibacter gossypiicola]
MARKKVDLKLPLPNKLAIYIRVSTQQQAKDGISALDQRMRGEKLAHDLGWDYEIYDDSGLSGTKGAEERQGLLRLLNDVEDRKIGGMYSVDIDRWSRDANYEEPQYIITKLKEAGIKIYFPGGEFNLSDPNIELMGRIKGVFASYESLQTKARVKRGLERSMTEGKNAGGGAMVAYGYDRINKVLEINEAEAAVVKKIFELYISGMGSFAISSYLKENGIPTKRNNTKSGQMRIGKKKVVAFKDGVVVEDKQVKQAKDFTWRDSVVMAILKNPIYKGEKRFNDYKIPCPIIIEPRVFDSVQLLFSERKKFKAPPNSTNHDRITKNKFLLKGLLVCGNSKCGKSFYGKLRADLKDKAYVCLSQKYKGEWCGNKGIDIDFLNDLVWKECLNIEKSIIQHFEKFETENSYNGNSSIKENLGKVEYAKEKLNELQKSKVRLLRNFNDEKINESDFNLLNSEYDNEIKLYEYEKLEAEKKLTVYYSKDNLIKSVKEYLKSFNPITATFEEKQNFIRAFVKRVTLARGLFWTNYYNPEAHRIYIEYKFNDLTHLRLSSKIEVGYKPNGHRSGEITHEISLEQQLWLGDGVDEGVRILDNIEHKY